MSEQTNYPNNFAINSARIASMHTEYGYGIRSKAYFNVKLTVPFNSNWIDIELWMTVFELKEVMKKSTNMKLRTFVEEELFEPRNKGFCAIKDGLNKYLHCKELKLEVLQAAYEEIPAEQVNLYTTKGILELLR